MVAVVMFVGPKDGRTDGVAVAGVVEARMELRASLPSFTGNALLNCLSTGCSDVGGAGAIGDVPDAILATGALGLGVSEAPVVVGNGVERVAARPNGA